MEAFFEIDTYMISSHRAICSNMNTILDIEQKMFLSFAKIILESDGNAATCLNQ